MQQILDAILAGDTPADDLAQLDLPESHLAVTVHKDEVDMFEGIASRDKDPRKSLHVEQVPMPELGPGEALVAVMASAINYNTVWTSIFEPVSTFSFLERYGRISPLAKRHDLPYHVVGSDLSGVVLKTGAGVHLWKAGDEVVAHCLSVELESPDGHNDTMLDPEQRIWGFETNFGGLAQIALVKSNQLMPKPQHLTWEEAASPGLVNSTAYRQLVSRNGAGMKQGDAVLIWGASGGLGGFATQYALNGGAIPVCVVSSEEKADICRSMGAELIINRSEEDYRFWKDEHNQDPKEWRRFGARIRELTGGDDVDIVFEHPGRETFGASVFAARKGGTIVTCASTSGLHARVRQPLPVDEPQADHRLPLRQLPRVVGGQPPHRQGHDPPDAVQDLPPRRGRPGRPRRAPQRPPGQGRRPLPGPRGGSRGPRPRDAGQAPRRDQPLPRRLSRSARSAERATTDAWSSAGTCFGAINGGPGVSCDPMIRHTGLMPDGTRSARRPEPSPTPRHGTGAQRMTDEGLSIFEDSENDTVEETASEVDSAAVEPEAPAAERPAAAAAPAPAAAARRRPAPLPAAAAPRPSYNPAQALAGLPVVRRGGYDTGAVDARIRQLATDKAELDASLSSSQRTIGDLQSQLDALKAELAENKTPSYAGLGGRASAMLRLAEEEAADIRAAAKREADEIREQAAREAKAIRADAVPRGRRHPDRAAQGDRGAPRAAPLRRRAGAQARPCRGRGPPGRGQAGVRPAPDGCRAGGERAAHQRDPRRRAAARRRRP